jgi:type II secretory ATPase GspE/PulE/Tfp pilus assembly ATPase PilB-like protein
MFSGIEKDEPSSRGLLGRFRALRSSFTEESPSSMPIAGSDSKPEPDREPKLRSKTKPLKAEPVDMTPGQPMTLGMRLRMADVSDVEAYDDVAAGDVVRHAPEMDGDSLATEVTATKPAQARQEADLPHAEPRVRTERQSGVSDRDKEDAVQPPMVDTAPAAPDEVHEVRAQADIAQRAPEFAARGLPELAAADALTFKRILTERGPDAALRINDAARREFIAVEIQAGMSIVVTTRSFHESALYATYVKDLERADIKVHEELLASADVISAIYAMDRNRSAAIVPESSRAIGTFRDVIEAAHSYGASDVHWEDRDFSSEVEVRFRVDGDLYTFRQLSKEMVRKSLAAAYQDLVQRNTNSGETFQPTAPQSAMIPLVVAADLLNLRWQSSPLVGGYDVALRMLDGNFKNPKVLLPEQMGLEESQLVIIEALGRVSGGASFVTGETGSAKSTLLRAMSFRIDRRDLRKQFAVSEPSEYPMPWLSDISITRRPDETDNEASRKYAEVIRTLMRMDPCDVTVNEIRDHVVAALVVELALTGHPIRSSLHADSLIGAVMRLVGGRLQLPVDEVASEKFLNAVSNQKLIPLLCPHCKVPAADVMPKAQLELLRSKFALDIRDMACRNFDGCEHCRRKGLFTRAGTVAAGAKGQTLAMEIYRPTPEFLDRVLVRDWRGAEKVWRNERRTGFDDPDMTGKTIYEHALYKASQGIIDPRFIDESMRTFESYRVFPDHTGAMPS